MKKILCGKDRLHCEDGVLCEHSSTACLTGEAAMEDGGEERRLEVRLAVDDDDSFRECEWVREEGERVGEEGLATRRFGFCTGAGAGALDAGARARQEEVVDAGGGACL